MSTIVTYPQRFYLEFRNFYETKDLLFVNSLGGIETIRLRGEVDASAEYTRIAADKINTPEYFTNGILNAQTENVFSTEQETFTGDTGFMPKENLDRLRDLFNNKMVFEIKNNRLLPITVSIKSSQWYTNRQSLYSISLQWQYSFINEYYSPAGLINAGGTCPAVESFAVIQSGRNRLTITWALETGYNKLQVEVVISAVSTFYTLEGNSGQEEIPFTNPNVEDGVDIDVKGTTVCNDLIEPADLGPTTTITRRIYPNQAPVAISDTFNIHAGYTSAQVLKGSVLDNDYDNNGDDFEVEEDSGSTTDGGTYAIDKYGIVTYTPPSSGYTGTDSFSYTITEIGDDALTGTATVYIVVSATPASSIIAYVKVNKRNVHKTGGLFHKKYYAEVWLEFYSDAAGTNPLDTTGIGITISVKKVRTGTSPSTAYATYPASSFQLKIYDGQYSATEFLGSDNWNTEWSVLPGSGYKAI